MARTRVKFHLNTKLKARLKRKSRRAGQSPENVVRLAIERYLNMKDFERVAHENQPAN